MSSSARLRWCKKQCTGCDRRIGLSHLCIDLVLTVLMVAVGIITGSKALAVSSIYSMRDFILGGIVLINTQQGDKTLLRDRAYDYGKLEYLVITGMSVLIFLAVTVSCFTILHSVLEHRQRPPGIFALWAALGSVVVCWIMARQARCAAQRSDNLAMSTYAQNKSGHMWVAVVVAASVAASRWGYVLIDPITAVFQAVSVAWCTGGILRQSVRGLLDASIGDSAAHSIKKMVQDIDGVKDVYWLQGFQRGHRMSISMMVAVPGNMTMTWASGIRKQITEEVCRMSCHVDEVLVEFMDANTLMK